MEAAKTEGADRLIPVLLFNNYYFKKNPESVVRTVPAVRVAKQMAHDT
jgi:hypothetical protein